ncbi:MAG: class I SAM-dependent methyltransferase [Nitrospirae bacterium]|nr:class I SAM-dependent methyltransferase [Nitrospirota bacterium]
MKRLLKKVLPESMLQMYRDGNRRLFQVALNNLEEKQVVKLLDDHGFNVSRSSDYYSPLPVLSALEENRDRWFKPSDLVGIPYDLEEMKDILKNLLRTYSDEYGTLTSYDENEKRDFGPGFTPIDSMVSYSMIRGLKPKRYLEVGSGLSTYYCLLAAKKNAEMGNPLQIRCIDPYPYEALCNVSGIEIIRREVQSLELSAFERLEAGDVLFIDSTHVVKIDGDVPYLYLEVLPRVKKGVIIHIHDVPFPYNVPYPPQTWIFGRSWPFYWTEAMLLQAFLCYNDAFKIMLSAPLLRYYDEEFLRSVIPDYSTYCHDPANTFSSLWIRKMK